MLLDFVDDRAHQVLLRSVQVGSPYLSSSMQATMGPQSTHCKAHVILREAVSVVVGNLFQKLHATTTKVRHPDSCTRSCNCERGRNAACWSCTDPELLGKRDSNAKAKSLQCGVWGGSGGS